jgi:hypothetical protein
MLKIEVRWRYRNSTLVMSSINENHNTPMKMQKVNAFNIFILIFVGLGSLSYGYTASVIGQTLVSFNTTILIILS